MKHIFSRAIFVMATLLTTLATWAQDIIITTDAQKIEAKILEVSKSEIRYKEKDNLDGPTFVLGTDEINSIIYSNGKVVFYNQQSAETPKQEKPVETTQVAQVTIDKEDLSIAHVESFSGVYVFTDCIPIGQYEILGDVYFNKEGERHISAMPTYGLSSSGSMRVTGTQIISYSETPQYTDIRAGLIAQAVMANRQVEGILLSIPKAGEGRATLIKFKEGTEDKSLAKVNSHLGVLVFTDCKPANAFSFVGKINNAGGLNSDYNVLRDRLIKKAKNKYPDAQGIIPRFVSGGHDSAEVINF